ncbi:DUF1259 domain-containing protein [Salirhabdus salicampi]|uniref:DUF1259 domain-containing protein n=1 Tax=Salirhabdus salicampi TaxID=476102 RepID=UPI00266C5490|nr:DUF1259 domain-containing protein [Salirhabdus salicampi]
MKRLCRRFARILDGQGSVTENGVCVVERSRNLRFTIEGIPTRSPLVVPQLFSFERKGRTFLNLGETVVLQREVNPLLRELKRRDITVTALHNHWLFEEPRAMYLHFQSTDDDPITFAKKVAESFRVLEH